MSRTDKHQLQSALLGTGGVAPKVTDPPWQRAEDESTLHLSDNRGEVAVSRKVAVV